MRKLTLFRLLPAAALLFSSAACDGPHPLTGVPAEAATLASADPALSENQRPAFSQQTVLKLNPIVERSKAALDRFDEIQPLLEDARKAKNSDRIAALETEIAKLKAETESAHSEFQAEKKALLTRDEYYDAIILGAMEQYVAEAPAEIAAALKPAAN